MTALGQVKSAMNRIPFKKGFLSGDLDVLESVRFVGSQCRACGDRLLGRRHRCENCSSADLADETYPSTGAVFTYTVQRYPPPAPYSAENPWRPRPLAWVDLDEGPQIGRAHV